MADEKQTTGRPSRGERPPRSGARARAGAGNASDSGGGTGTRTRPTTEPDPTQQQQHDKKRTPTDRRIAESLTGTYQMVGGVVVTIGMRAEDRGLVGTGTALIERADVLSDAWIELANQNPKVKTALRRFTEGSQTATLIALHVACVMPLLLDRGILPPQAGMFMAMGGAAQNGGATS